MAKAKRASIKTVPTIEYNVFIRPIPPEVIRRGLELQKKACSLNVHDFTQAFTV